MASSVWSGYLTFGLISLPVRLFSGARGEHVSFHMLHRDDNTRVKQQLWCPHDERVVERSEIVKGYEYRKGEYVIVEPEEIKKIEPKGKEYTVFLRPYKGGMMLHTMYYKDEVRELDNFGRPDVELKDAEVKVAHQLIEALAGDFDPEKYHDSFQENLKTLIKARLEGEEVTPVEKPKKMAPVVDLMAALKESLAQVPKKPAQRVEAAQRASEIKVAAKAKKTSRKKTAA